MRGLYTATALSPDAAEVAEFLAVNVRCSRMGGPSGTGCVMLRISVAESLAAMLGGTATDEQRGQVAAELAAVTEVIERLTRLAGERAAGKRKRKAGG